MSKRGDGDHKRTKKSSVSLSLSVKCVGMIPPDLVVSKILPYVLLHIHIRPSAVHIICTISVCGEISKCVLDGRSCELWEYCRIVAPFGYFERGVTKAIWMVFRSIHIHGTSPRHPYAMKYGALPRFNAPQYSISDISIQPSTVQHLSLAPDVRCGCLTLVRLSSLQSFVCKMFRPIVLHPSESGLRKVIIQVMGTGKNFNPLGTPVCNLDTLPKLTSLSVCAPNSVAFPIVAVGEGLLHLRVLQWRTGSSPCLIDAVASVLSRSRETIVSVYLPPIFGRISLHELAGDGPFPRLFSVASHFTVLYLHLFRVVTMGNSLDKNEQWQRLLSCFPAAWVIESIRALTLYKEDHPNEKIPLHFYTTGSGSTFEIHYKKY